MKTSENEVYLKFYEEFSQLLKEGVGQDFSNRERLMDLLEFESTKTEAGKFTTLEQYLAGMTTEQTEIFYLIGESRGLIEKLPVHRSLPRQGPGSAAADRSDRRIPGVQTSANTRGKNSKSVDKGKRRR